jgi:hypothetical protein
LNKNSSLILVSFTEKVKLEKTLSKDESIRNIENDKNKSKAIDSEKKTIKEVDSDKII